LNQPEKAIDCLVLAAILSPKDLDKWKQLAKYFFKFSQVSFRMASDNGKHDLAVYLYKKILRSKPNDFEELKNLGRSYCILDNHKKAIETYSVLFEKFSDDPEFEFFFFSH
jgi:tetratricopeptide (TPR) repeat protein